MSHSRNGYSPSMSFLVYILVYHIFLSLLSLALPTSSFTIPKCVTSTKHGMLLFFGVVSSISFSNLCLFSCNSSFLPSNSCIFFDNAFLYTCFCLPVSSNIFIPIQHRHHPKHQLYLLILCDNDVGSQFVG